MAAGDAYTFGPTDVAAGAFGDLRPAGGAEIVIHNIAYGNQVELYHSDGTTNLLVDADGGSGAMTGRFYHATNGLYYRVKNTSGSTIKVTADGMYTK